MKRLMNSPCYIISMSDSIKCIGFIMDGNRRWAKDQGLPTIEGHQKGAEVFEETIKFIYRKKISNAIFYGFSSENWNRSEDEVLGLMELFSVKLTELNNQMREDGSEDGVKVRLKFVGDIKKFSPAIQEKIKDVEEGSVEYTDTTIWIALSYGGRAELVSAVNRAIENGEAVTEETFEQMLWTKGMPDPDLIIRTGGQQRLSNFLPWQSVYSEFVFTNDFWPDLNPEKLEVILDDFVGRKRNFGK